MNKPNVTPGPWYVKEYHSLGQWSDEEPGEIRIVDGDDVSIATVDPWGTGGDREMGAANARAISELPNMANALHDMVRGAGKEFSERYGFAKQRRNAISALKQAGFKVSEE